MLDLLKENILTASVVGFEVEMFSNKPRKEIAKELSDLLKKKVRVGGYYHSPIIVDKDTFKLEQDYSGGSLMTELITGPMPYREAMACLFKILGWMKQNAWTTESCALQANISFDKFKIKLNDKMEAINRMKFVLGFDEDFVYQKFPKRKNSIYARSINSIYPINRFAFTADITHVYKENYELPNEKYYGINFAKLPKGYLEIRYMGGRGYEKDPYAAKDVIDYIILFTHDVLQNNNSYTTAEVSRLRNSMKDMKKMVSSFNDYDSFCYNYPNMRLLIDLKGDREIVRTFYPKVREKVFDLIMRCGVRRGVINYDSDVSTYQIKGAVISKAFSLKGVEAFDCKINGGNVLDCDLYRCEINNSHIMGCNIKNGNKINKCKVIDSPLNMYNSVVSSYIDNKHRIINCKVEKSIIRSGDVGALAKISDDTETIKVPGDKKGGDKEKDTKDFKRTAPGFRMDKPIK